LPDLLWLILKWVIPSSIRATATAGALALLALFGSAYFGELTALKGEAGAKQVIQKNLGKAHLLPFAGGEIDVDTPNDFARLQWMRT
jgi:molybdenum cofactor cytidylyltransferase